MEQRTNKPQNKGFTVYHGETFVGYFTLNEKNVPANTLAAMQVPENIQILLPQCEMRPYTEKKDQDMSAIDALLAGAQAGTDNAIEPAKDEL